METRPKLKNSDGVQRTLTVKLSYLPSEEGKKPVIFEYFTLRVSLAEKIQLDPKRVMALQEIMEIS